MSILKKGMYASQSTVSNYLTFSSDAPFSIKFNQISWDGVLEYSPDTQNWYELDTSEINSSGNVLYLRGTGNSYITGSAAIGDQAGYAMQITATDGVECTGNIMSLLDHANPDNVAMGYAAFIAMFQDCIKLTAAPELPATVLATYCYNGMFRGTGIAVAPELPATVLVEGCYNYMFFNCINLTVAPELPATVLAAYCYGGMFRGTGIAISETQTGVYQTPWSIPSVGTIADTPFNWSANMLASTSGTFTGNPAINTTYYQVV